MRYQNGNNTYIDREGRRSGVYKSNTYIRQARIGRTKNLPPLAQANRPLLGKLTSTFPCIGLRCLLGIHIGVGRSNISSTGCQSRFGGGKRGCKGTHCPDGPGSCCGLGTRLHGSAIGTALWFFCLSRCAFAPSPRTSSLGQVRFACHLPLPLVWGPPLLALHTSF